jgi:hypothetical protein
MKYMLSRTLLLALSMAAGAQELTKARIGPLPEQPGRTVEAIRAAVERQAVYQTGAEYVIPQLIVGGEWSTSIRLTNRGALPITAGRAAFVDNTGKSMSLTVQSPSGTPQTVAGFAFTLQPGGIVEVNLPSDTGNAFGYVLIDPASCPPTAACSLYGEVVLRNRNSTRPDFESLFPSELPTDLQYMLFDHRNGFSTVLYLINSNSTPTTVELEFRGTGNQLIQSASVSLQSGEAQIVSPHALAPDTIGQLGTMVIRGTNAATRALVVVTGLRINPSNSFTPLRAFVPKP